MAMLKQAEAQAAAQGQQMGAQYADAMMQNLDNAEDAEGVINAIRGNQKPLESRRMELASFVGSEDANATPESVLALVQPVIMMTEQGAMDSGIGELMQGLVGDVDMQASGMDEGVGSLMMAGAPEAPAPQNFNQGGAVQSFRSGGGAFSGYSPTVNYRNPKANGMMPLLSDETSAIAEEFGSEALMAMAGRGQGAEKDAPRSTGLRGYYEEMLPLYKELLGDTEEQRNYNKAQTYFDIAQAGLNLASGVDPRTGKSTAGQPLGSQIASAASQLGPSIQARAAEDRQLERQSKAGALDLAGKFMMQDRQAGVDYQLAIAKARATRGLKGPDYKVAIDPKTGKTIGTYDVNDVAQERVVEALISNGAEIRNPSTQARPDFKTVRIQTDKGPIIGTTTNELATIRLPDGREIFPPEGPGVHSIVELSPETAAATQDKDRQIRTYRDKLAQLDDPESSPEEAREITITSVTPAEASSLQAFRGVYEKQIKEEFGESVTADQLNSAFTFINDNGIPQVMDAYTAAMGGTGAGRFVSSTLNKYLGSFRDLDPSDIRLEQMRQYLRAIRFIGKVALVQNPRFPVAEMVQAELLFPNPDTFWQSPEVEAEKMMTMKAITDDIYRFSLAKLADPATPPEMRKEYEHSLGNIELLRKLMGPVPSKMSSNLNQLSNPLMSETIDTNTMTQLGYDA
jgi:hypothetical protein